MKGWKDYEDKEEVVKFVAFRKASWGESVLHRSSSLSGSYS